MDIDFAKLYGSIYVDRKLKYLKDNSDMWKDVKTGDIYSGNTINSLVVDTMNSRHTIEFDKHKMPNI